jgi:hypothetical protein
MNGMFCVFPFFTIAASSFIRNILRFFHEITTLNHNAFDSFRGFSHVPPARNKRKRSSRNTKPLLRPMMAPHCNRSFIRPAPTR